MFDQVDPSNPYLYMVKAGDFGGPNDPEDSGKTASGEPTDMGGRINPKNYVAVPQEFINSGAVKYHDKILIKNPKTGQQVIGEVLDKGPAHYTGRGLDIAPHTMKALGAETDQPLEVDFSPQADSPWSGANKEDLTLGQVFGGDAEDQSSGLGDIGQDTPGSLAAEGAAQANDAQDTQDTQSGQAGQPQTTTEDAGSYFPGLSSDPSQLHVVGELGNGFTEYNDGSLYNSSTGVLGMKLPGGKTVYYGKDGKKISEESDVRDQSFNMQDPTTGYNRRFTIQNGALHMIPFAGEGAEIDPSTTGDAALEGLTPEQQVIVKQMTSYNKPPLNISYRNPMALKLMARAHMYDPNYDEKKYEVQKGLLKDFARTGPTSAGGAVTSANTALRHIGEAWDAFQKLENSHFKGYNSIANMIKNQVNDPDLSAYQTAKRNMSSELAKAFTGNAPQIQTILEQMKNLDETKDNPSAYNSFLTTASMIYQRLDEVGQKWEEGFDKPYPRLLHAPAKKVLGDFGLLSAEGSPEDLQQKEAESGQSGTTRVMAGGKPVEPDKPYYDAQGNKAYFRNGRWEDEDGNPVQTK
jgi:hypothetical protein